MPRLLAKLPTVPAMVSGQTSPTPCIANWSNYRQVKMDACHAFCLEQSQVTVYAFWPGLPKSLLYMLDRLTRVPTALAGQSLP